MRLAINFLQQRKEKIMKPYVTLVDLVEIVSEFAQTESELIATVIHLIKSGQVEIRSETQAQPMEQAHAYA
jgi:hypothetical protein